MYHEDGVHQAAYHLKQDPRGGCGVCEHSKYLRQAAPSTPTLPATSRCTKRPHFVPKNYTRTLLFSGAHAHEIIWRPHKA